MMSQWSSLKKSSTKLLTSLITFLKICVTKACDSFKSSVELLQMKSFLRGFLKLKYQGGGKGRHAAPPTRRPQGRDEGEKEAGQDQHQGLPLYAELHN